jgi:anti-sigma-K factor RskA
MHLQPEEFVDLAEGTRADASAPHLKSCTECRQQLAQMRAMMAAAVVADVPEPSPLFWDHLSARVHDAVAAEGAPRQPWLDLAAWRRVLMPASAIATVVLVVFVLSSRVKAPQPVSMPDSAAFVAVAPSATGDANTGTEVLGDAAADDASLMLVASMTSAIDLDAASDAGLAPAGSADHAVTHLPPDELRELQRLLRKEMGAMGS